MYPYLKFGTKLPSVAAAQILLNRKLKRGSTLTVDGIFGSKTKKAVEEFQVNDGSKYVKRLGKLKKDGVIGVNTWAHLNTSKHGPFQVIDAVDVTNPSDVGYEDEDIKHVGGRPIRSYGMCNGVEQVVHDIIARSYPGSVVLLRFHGHGASGGMNISAGTEDMPGARADFDIRDIHKLTHILSRLKPIFCEFGSVELHGCNTGRGSKGSNLLDHLARAFGVPVSAGVYSQLGGGLSTFRFEGPVKTKFPSGSSLTAWAKNLSEAPGMSIYR